MSKVWMPLYIGDYLRDTQHLTPHQHGAYLLLIMHYWQHGELPNNQEALARISHQSRGEWRSNCQAIAKLFLPDWRHKRIDKELAKAKQLSDKRAVFGAIGGRRNHGLNNIQRLNGRLDREAIAKQTDAHNHNHIEEEAVDNGDNVDKSSKNVASGELETIIRRKQQFNKDWR